ncbi:hypothetical protein LuPra_02601 [Luteitalea pratensis]|uniref:Uncharacterized protein n=1 Tax=Luteitalea pratensis TaxID=1855912 RepID=A0A143PLT1_LUTPR|nr:hypothetical protein LuPra_02601 [Luteitalea pratensis]
MRESIGDICARCYPIQRSASLAGVRRERQRGVGAWLRTVEAGRNSIWVGFYEAARAGHVQVVVPPIMTARVSRHGPRSHVRGRTIADVDALGRREWNKASDCHQLRQVSGTHGDGVNTTTQCPRRSLSPNDENSRRKVQNVWACSPARSTAFDTPPATDI